MVEPVTGATAAPTDPPQPPAYLPLSDYPVELVAIARYRLDVIRPLLALPSRTRVAVQARVSAIQIGHPADGERTLQTTVSIAAVYRWIADYTRSDDVRALIPAVHDRGGKHDSRLRTVVNVLIEGVIHDKGAVPEKITIDDLHHELAVQVAEENRVRPAADQLPLPSRATLARRWAAAEIDPTSAVRPNSQALKQYGQTPYPDLPLDRVEIDHTRTDLIVLDDHDLPLGALNFDVLSGYRDPLPAGLLPGL